MANDFSGDANCVALWKFENGALLTDSKGTNTLTDFNTVVADTVNFKEGAASALFTPANLEMFYCLDGNLDAGFPLKNGDATKVFSVCMWFRAASDINCALFGKGASGTYSLHVEILGATDNNKLYIYNGYNSGASVESVNHATSLTMDGSVWYHLGLVLDGVNKTIFAKLQLADGT